MIRKNDKHFPDRRWFTVKLNFLSEGLIKPKIVNSSAKNVIMSSSFQTSKCFFLPWNPKIIFQRIYLF